MYPARKGKVEHRGEEEGVWSTAADGTTFTVHPPRHLLT